MTSSRTEGAKENNQKPTGGPADAPLDDHEEPEESVVDTSFYTVAPMWVYAEKLGLTYNDSINFLTWSTLLTIYFETDDITTIEAQKGFQLSDHDKDNRLSKEEFSFGYLPLCPLRIFQPQN